MTDRTLREALERAQFEKWRNDYFGPLYTNVESSAMWSAWQARATLAAPSAEPVAPNGPWFMKDCDWDGDDPRTDIATGVWHDAMHAFTHLTTQRGFSEWCDRFRAAYRVLMASPLAAPAQPPTAEPAVPTEQVLRKALAVAIVLWLGGQIPDGDEEEKAERWKRWAVAFCEQHCTEGDRIDAAIDAAIAAPSAEAEPVPESAQTERGQMAAPQDGMQFWLWKNGDHFLAFTHLYPCFTPGGDPMVLGEPVGRAVFKRSFDRAGGGVAAGQAYEQGAETAI